MDKKTELATRLMKLCGVNPNTIARVMETILNREDAIDPGGSRMDGLIEDLIDRIRGEDVILRVEALAAALHFELDEIESDLGKVLRAHVVSGLLFKLAGLRNPSMLN